MKKLILIVLLIFIISLTISAEINPFLRFLFESAVETDRYQSYNWHHTTKENPGVYVKENKIVDGKLYRLEYLYYESNPFVAGSDREQFDNILDDTKKAVNNINHIIENKKTANIIYALITTVQLYNIYDNNLEMERYNFPQTWTISYSWEF